MDFIKDYLNKQIEERTFNHKSIIQFEELLLKQKFSNKNKQILQGFVLDSLMNNNESREAAKWFLKIYALLEKSDEETLINEAYFSPGEDCRNAIVNQLKKATTTVHICVFTISDDLIANEILACKQRGISLKIITDDDKSMDKGSDIHELADKGVPVKMDTSPNHMHHKFAIIDNKTLITGSYNWTRSAYERNQENLLVTNSIDLIEKYETEFGRLWAEF